VRAVRTPVRRTSHSGFKITDYAEEPPTSEVEWPERADAPDQLIGCLKRSSMSRHGSLEVLYHKAGHAFGATLRGVPRASGGREDHDAREEAEVRAYVDRRAA